jgi:steroid 5-alpha reductase family enzyme
MQQLFIVLIVAAAITFVCWALSMLTKDYSWVDRIWSLAPIAYAWIFAWPVLGSAFSTASVRTLVMAILITLWGLRLTFNFARKGGYSGMEDYRWSIVRKAMKPWQWQIFNILFTDIYQNALLVLITIPVGLSAAFPSAIGFWDLVFIILFVIFLVMETVADQQQWNFQQSKKRAGGTLEPGFVNTGMFHYSRHPNFFSEQAQWWVIYFLGASAAVRATLALSDAGSASSSVLSANPWGWIVGHCLYGAINWSIVGVVLLLAVFIGSTKMTESISAKKYPLYAQYQKTTSALVPWFVRKSR